MDCDGPIIYILRASTVEMSPKRKNHDLLYSDFKPNNKHASTSQRKKSLQQNPEARVPAPQGGLAEALVSAHGMHGGLQWPGRNLCSPLVAVVLCVG